MDNGYSCSSDEENFEFMALLALKLKRWRRKKKRQYWVRPIFQRHREQGDYYNLLQELRLSDPQCHFRFLRMSKERFDSLLSKVGVINL